LISLAEPHSSGLYVDTHGSSPGTGLLFIWHINTGASSRHVTGVPSVQPTCWSPSGIGSVIIGSLQLRKRHSNEAHPGERHPSMLDSMTIRCASVQAPTVVGSVLLTLVCHLSRCSIASFGFCRFVYGILQSIDLIRAGTMVVSLANEYN
jgi:hypothetical protein